MTTRERRLARADRLEDWADRRRAKSAQAFRRAHTIASAIPFGQPILVGHHSEAHARRDQDRIHAGMRAGIDHADKAADMAGRADTIREQAERAIYSDDVDAIDALKARIATLEAQRARIKTVNARIRKVGLEAALPELTEDEKRELLTLMRICPYHRVETRGFPAYTLQNLGGNITRQRQRLASLSGTPTAAPES